MMTYEFTLIIREIGDERVEALYARCDDASTGRSNGVAYVAFDREAESLESAIDTAVGDLRSVGIQPLRIEMPVPAAVS